MEADEKKCPQCAGTVKDDAKFCCFCGHSFQDDVLSNPGGLPLPNKGKGRGKGCLMVLTVLFALGIIGSLVGPGKQTTPSSNMVASENVRRTADITSDPVSTTHETSATKEPEIAPSAGLFGSQANAARSAQQYLAMTGFSRQGLIDQLSSNAGSGYNVTDATAAVDSLTVNWNEQAARSAKQYLDMSGLSCSGLIEQLSSDAGSKYTGAQARYGAEQVGAC